MLSFSVLVKLLLLISLAFYSSSSASNTTLTTTTILSSNSTTSNSDVDTASVSIPSSITSISYVSGSAAVESCYLAWASWYSDLAVWQTTAGDPTTQIRIYNLTNTIYSTYKLCDGIPRAVTSVNGSYYTTTEYLTGDGYTVAITSVVVPSPIILSITTTLATYTDVFPQVSLNKSDFTSSSPMCTIAPTDCASLYAASSNAMWTGGSFNISPSPKVLCQTEVNSPTASCVILIPTVQLIYWPVTLASQDLCNYPSPIDITATPTADAPVPIATVFNTTFTSDGNVYLSYDEVTIFTNHTRQYISPGFLTLPSSELQSFRGVYPYNTVGNIYSFNFADLLPNHVPILAYEGTGNCENEYNDPYAYPFCQTILEDIYAPNLVYPTEFYNKFPQYSNCAFNYLGLYDPPTYLIPADYLTPTNTAMGGPPSTPASPASSPISVTPPPTTVSFTQAQPPTTGAAPSSTATAGPGLGSGSNGGGANGDGAGVSGDQGASSDDSLDPGTSLADPEPPSTVVTVGGNPVTVAAPAGGGTGTGTGTGNNGVAIDGTSLAQGEVATVGGQTVSALADGAGAVIAHNGQTTTVRLADAAAVAVITLGDGGTVTASSWDAPGGAPVVVVGAQTLTAGGAVTTGGAVLSLGAGGLVVSGAGSGAGPSDAGAVFAVGATTLTAVESVDGQGSTVVVVGGVTATVGASPVTLPNGETLSAGASGLMIVGSGGTSSVSYSAIVTASSTPSAEVTPQGSIVTLLPVTTGSSTAAAKTTSKKGDSPRMGINMSCLLVASFFTSLWVL